MERNQLIETVTREVLAIIGSGGGEVKLGLDNADEAVANGAARLGFNGNGCDVPTNLAQYIDHTVLKPDVAPDKIDTLCDEAMQYEFAAVCLNPVWVQRAARRVRGSKVKVASVVGFPLGANVPEIKAMEARRAIRDGAREIDMVMNIGALKGGDRDLVRRDIAGVSDACREVGAINKVIIEACYLTDEEKVVACRLAQLAHADFVKTSTGFGPGGATVFDVALMRETVGLKMGVKAAGGIHDANDARAMISAGANRIGASAGIRIVSGDEGGSGESY
jgi:deoxyribose-phosphate aldolase